ncbi:MAG: hypothetical protein ACTSXL_03090 [Alphaproteobacteria bacterium]|nr:MAG: hypothetical protein B6I23_00720 [Rickettsiaceae bacterium 4572_127]
MTDKLKKIVKNGNEEMTYVSQAFLYGPKSVKVKSDEINIPSEKKTYWKNGKLKTHIIYGYQRIAEEQLDRTMELKATEYHYHENGEKADTITYNSPIWVTEGEGKRQKVKMIQEEGQHVSFDEEGKKISDTVSAGGPGYGWGDSWALKKTLYKNGKPVSVHEIYQNNDYDKNKVEDRNKSDFYNKINLSEYSSKENAFSETLISIEENGDQKIERGWVKNKEHIFAYFYDKNGNQKTIFTEKEGRASVRIGDKLVEHNATNLTPEISQNYMSKALARSEFMKKMQKEFPEQYMETAQNYFIQLKDKRNKIHGDGKVNGS